MNNSWVLLIQILDLITLLLLHFHPLNISSNKYKISNISILYNLATLLFVCVNHKVRFKVYVKLYGCVSSCVCIIVVFTFIVGLCVLTSVCTTPQNHAAKHKFKRQIARPIMIMKKGRNRLCVTSFAL